MNSEEDSPLKSQRSKKEKSPSGVARDIEHLFARAGMIGAKYRNFRRPEAAAAVASEDGEGAKPIPAARPSFQPLAGQGIARSIPASPLHSKSAPPVPWSSVERIFADRTFGEPLEPVRTGVKVALLSLSGGVGKTTLAVTLARILSTSSRQVLLADCGLFPAIPHPFATNPQRLGPLQFFYAPPAVAGAPPIGMFRLPLSELRQRDFQDLLERVEESDSLLLLDWPTMQTAGATDVLGYADRVLVPVTPDVHSVGALAHLKQLLADAGTAGHPHVHYVINRFVESRVLHREIRARIEAMLGDSLLPGVIHEDPAIEEASARGVTIVDYRPDSTAHREIAAVAQWIGTIAAPPIAVLSEGVV